MPIYVGEDQRKPLADFLWKALGTAGGVTISERGNGDIVAATAETQTTITSEGRES